MHAQVRHLFAGRGIEPDDLDDDAPIRLAAATLPGRQSVADVISAGGVGSVGLPESYPLDVRGDPVPHEVTRTIGGLVHEANLRGVWCRSGSRSRPRTRVVSGRPVESDADLVGAETVRSVAPTRPASTEVARGDPQTAGRMRRTRPVLTMARRNIQAVSPIQIPAMPSDGTASTASPMGTIATR